MLNFTNRFHGRGSIRTVLRVGRALRNDYLTIKYADNPRRHTPRFAVVVSKKVQKSAVKRNRIRRRLYEILRLETPSLSPSSDIVFIVTSSECTTMPAADLHQLVKGMLTQAHLYKTTKK